jgi:hypothetical protein
LAFGSLDLIRRHSLYDQLRKAYPQAYLLGCSAGGLIAGNRLKENALLATAIEFKTVQVRGASAPLRDAEDSRAAGARIALALPPRDLRCVFVLTPGVQINGSAFLAGLSSGLPSGVAVTGGLAGDGAPFRETLVLANAPSGERHAAAVGLYGRSLKIAAAGSNEGRGVGPERLVTRSQGNILYELDGRPALEVYGECLGEDAERLPGTGLEFPLGLREPGRENWATRTLLAVNTKDASLTFGGEVPQGHLARLLRCGPDRLIAGAAAAARDARAGLGPTEIGLAILVSFWGRMKALKKRAAEEIESACEALGPRALAAGFHAYGDFSPDGPEGESSFHNHGMAVTALGEDEGRA